MFYTIMVIRNTHLDMAVRLCSKKKGIYTLIRPRYLGGEAYCQGWERNPERYTRPSFRVEKDGFSLFLFGFKSGMGCASDYYMDDIPIIRNVWNLSPEGLKSMWLFEEDFIQEFFEKEIDSQHLKDSRLAAPFCARSAGYRNLQLV